MVLLTIPDIKLFIQFHDSLEHRVSLIKFIMFSCRYMKSDIALFFIDKGTNTIYYI